LSLLALLAIVTTSQEANSQNASGTDEVVSIIHINDVPLTDAIKNLSRHLGGFNFIFDPRVPGSGIGPGGRILQPSVKYRRKNVTAHEALQEVLRRNKLVMITNPATTIVRFAPAGLGLKPVAAIEAGTDTNEIHPEFRVTGRLDYAVKRVAEQAQISVDFDPAILRRGDLEGDVWFMWSNVTARQALTALLDNYSLAMTEDTTTSRARITLQKEPANDAHRKQVRRCTCNGVHCAAKRISQSDLSARLMVKEAVLQDLGVSPTKDVSDRVLFLAASDQEKPHFARLYVSPSVMVGNDCEVAVWTTMVDGGVIDTRTGKHATICHVSISDLKIPDAKAAGGMFFGALGGFSYSYGLRFQDGKWVIVSKELGVVF